MPKNISDGSDSDSQQQKEKFHYKKPQVWRLDKFKNLKKIVINLSTTQYPVVTDVAQDLGWKVQYDMEAGDWDVYWTDIPIDTDTLIKLHLFQKINYYPGIHTLARKNLLGMNLMNMKQRFPNDYNFFPLTWMLPQQYSQFRQYYQNKQQGKTRTYIVKPQAQCQGRGIFLTRNIEDLQNGKHYVVQRYIAKPYLMEGLKFDLRIYVLLAGTNPLRLYIYQDGLARFATQKYVQPTNQNLQHQFMHLTNYAINKRSPKFVFNNSSTNMGIGHKRSLKAIYQQMKKRGLNVDKLKVKINDLIIKTIIAGLPLMSHQYKCCQPEDYSNSMCFHVIGFDVMLDHKQEPQLIQINHTPSFATDTPLDYKIKFNLIRDTLKLMHITSKRKNMLFNKAKQSNQARLQAKKRLILDGQQRQKQIKLEQQMRDEYENKHLGGYTRIYPLVEKDDQKTQYYQSLMQGSYKMHYAENTPIRIKMQEIQKKKQVQEDMKKIKKIQINQKKKQNPNQSLISNSKIKRTNTLDPNLKAAIQQMTNFSVKKTNSYRQDIVAPIQKESQINNQQDQEKSNQQNQIKSNSFVYQKTSTNIIPKNQSSKIIRQTHSKQKFNCCPTYMDVSQSTQIKIISSEANISLSQSTANTKNQEQKIDESMILHSSYKGYDNVPAKNMNVNKSQNNLNADDNLSNSNIRGCPKLLSSIEKQLMKSQIEQVEQSLKGPKNSPHFINFSQKAISLKQKQRIQGLSELGENCRSILREFQAKQKIYRSDEKKRKNSRQSEILPYIYDHFSQISNEQSRKSQNPNKTKSTTKNARFINSIATDMKQIIQNKSKKGKPQLDIKSTQVTQMARLIARKVNFNYFKGNQNHLTNHIPNAIGPGGFVIPKMYQLNVQLQKRMENPQNIFNMISKKNVNKQIFQF